MAQISTRLYWLFQSLIAFIPYLLAGLLAGTLVLALGVFLLVSFYGIGCYLLKSHAC